MGKVAVASRDGIRVDTHFGKADTYQIYQIHEDGSFEFLETRVREGEASCDADCSGCGGHSHQKFDTRLIEDCEFVLVSKIGMHAQQFLASKGITAYDVEESIDTAIKKIIDYHARLAARKRLQLEKKGT
jgi:predicted Fe-Mo cluster-binding NifX family protein